MRGDLRLKDFKDALLKAIPLRKEQLAQVVWARWIGISTNIFSEALTGAVHFEPVKKRIAT